MASFDTFNPSQLLNPTDLNPFPHTDSKFVSSSPSVISVVSGRPATPNNATTNSTIPTNFKTDTTPNTTLPKNDQMVSTTYNGSSSLPQSTSISTNVVFVLAICAAVLVLLICIIVYVRYRRRRSFKSQIPPTSEISLFWSLYTDNCIEINPLDENIQTPRSSLFSTRNTHDTELLSETAFSNTNPKMKFNSLYSPTNMPPSLKDHPLYGTV